MSLAKTKAAGAAGTNGSTIFEEKGGPWRKDGTLRALDTLSGLPRQCVGPGRVRGGHPETLSRESRAGGEASCDVP